MQAKVKKINPKATIPTRAHESDTGYDITILNLSKIVGDVMYFGTGIALEPPEGYYFEVYPRSSISKYPLELANSVGIIDEHYRGEVIIPVRLNHPENGMDIGRTTFPNGVCKIFDVRPHSIHDVANLVLSKAPKLFQLILRKKESCEFISSDDLTQTERGAGGFGSTDSKPKKEEPKQAEKKTPAFRRTSVKEDGDGI